VNLDQETKLSMPLFFQAVECAMSVKWLLHIISWRKLRHYGHTGRASPRCQIYICTNSGRTIRSNSSASVLGDELNIRERSRGTKASTGWYWWSNMILGL
jgi:hypothetical protein